MSFSIGGIEGALLLPLVIQELKSIFPGPDKSRWLVALVVLLGVGLSVLQQVVVTYPQIEPWVVSVASGIVVAFAAMGTYDTARASIAYVAPRTSTVNNCCHTEAVDGN